MNDRIYGIFSQLRKLPVLMDKPFFLCRKFVI